MGRNHGGFNNNTNLGNRYYINITEKIVGSDTSFNRGYSINSNFALGVYGSTWNEKNVYTINENKLYVSLNGIETLQEFKNMLNAKSMNIMMLLQDAIEIPLATEEIAAYKSLHTNTPNTIITNDENVWMKVTYRKTKN